MRSRNPAPSARSPAWQHQMVGCDRQADFSGFNGSSEFRDQHRIQHIGQIFTLMGLSRASRDEEAFKGAFNCSLINLIVTVILNILMAFGIGGSVLRSISTIISLILTILMIAYIFKGIDNLAGKLGRSDVSAAGRGVLTFLWVVYAVTIFCDLMILLFPTAAVFMGIMGVISFLAGIGMIIGYILYLVHLNRAKQMLQ